MEAISFGFIVSAFIAGLLTFLAPCTLPLVPGYLALISGVRREELTDSARVSLARRKIFITGLFFITGFSVIFIIFGTLAGLVGQTLGPFRLWVGRLGGILVIIFGLSMLGLVRIPALAIERRPNLFKWVSLGRPSGSLILGGAFAFGWTPCVGPILGSILLLAGSQTTALTGGLLLAIFSLGLAVPFLAIAYGFSSATKYIAKAAKYLKAVNIIGGVFLILLGLLLITDNFSLLISYGYRLFDFINYDRLLNYL